MNDSKKKPRLILVCGSWGSGTSVVAQILKSIGLETDGDCLKINDQRNTDSVESLRFRQVVQTILSEDDLKLRVDRDQAIKLLGDYVDLLKQDFYKGDTEKILFLKYPLATLLVELLTNFFDLRVIGVFRPLKAVEASRTRRGWSNLNLGSQGARIIYSYLSHILINTRIPMLIIRYEELQKIPEAFVHQIAFMAGIKKNQEEIVKISKIVQSRG